MFETHVVSSFGGGLNLTANPRALRDDEWPWSDGWLPKDGCAEVLPAYTQINSGSYLVAGQVPGGLFQNPFDNTKPGVLLTVSVAGTGAPHLYTISSAGVPTEITSGVLTSNLGGWPKTAAFLNGNLVFTMGTGTAGGPVNHLGIWAGAATFTLVVPAGGNICGMFLGSLAGHLILANQGGATAGQGRTIMISDAQAPTVWTPAISNSADVATLDTLSGITGAARAGGNLFAVFTRDAVFGLSPTGSIPPFTLQLLETRGALDGGFTTIPTRGQFLGETPYGLAYLGGDDFYMLGGQGFGRKVFAYYRSAMIRGLTNSGSDLNQGQPYLWHPSLGVLMIGEVGAVLQYDPAQQAWSRRSLPTIFATHAIINEDQGGPLLMRHWLVDHNGVLWREQTTADPTTTQPQLGAFVDTRDFSFDDPTRMDFVDRIKVDWEALTNLGTDAIDVLAYTRNDLNPDQEGTDGGVTDFTNSFQPLGTLTAGQGELPVRVKGKYTRFRFQQNSGRSRIRGFTIRRERGGDRVT